MSTNRNSDKVTVYGFAAANGMDLDRGKQLTEKQAHTHAVFFAMTNGGASYWIEGSPLDEDGVSTTLVNLDADGEEI
jgi:hypothetical protein